MSEAIYRQDGETLDYTPAAAVTGGEVVQLPDGRSGVVATDVAAAALGGARVCGIVRVLKTASIVLLEGAKVFWDASANTATYAPANDQDFYLGVAVADAAAAGTTVDVALNEEPRYIIDLQRDAFESVPVLTAGAPLIRQQGGTSHATFSATAEAQKLDLLSKRSFPVDSSWILEADLEIVTDADAAVADLNVGVANATHASDADTITNSCFFHFDLGSDNNIDAESDDDDAVEVAATDTTVDWAAGTPLHLTIDGRDPADCQLYINGVNVLPDSVFDLSAISNPLKALFHLEKTANDSPGAVELDNLNVRIAS